MRQVRGNLITLAEQGHFDVIVHGCNCFHQMDAGIAKEIAKRYPGALLADKSQTKMGDRSKLGSLSYYHTSQFVIVNAYTQYGYGWGNKHLDEDALRSCFNTIGHDWHSKRIGYPLIGAGLAGGDWNVIAPIIDEQLEGLNHTLVIWDGT